MGNRALTDRNPELAYQPVLLSRGGRFCVYLAELEIAGVGDTLDEAYASYKVKLEETFQLANEWGVGARCIESRAPGGARGMREELFLFAAKALIAVFVAIFVVVAFLPNIKAAYCKLSGDAGATCARR